MAAGADVLYAPGLTAIEDIRTLCGALDKPVNVIAGISGFELNVADLSAAGVKRISVGSAFARVALGSFTAAARQVKEQGSFNFTDQAASFRDISKFMQRRE